MPFHHHNACLESNHYLQTLMTDHASHLRVRSSFQAIHYALLLFLMLLLLVVVLLLLHAFFHRSQEQEAFRQES